MRPHPLLPAASLLLAALLCSARPAGAAWPHDPNNGNVPLSSFASNQVYPRMISDGAGGAFIAWHELRSSYDIYAQHVSASGATTWGAAGVPVCSAANDQANTALASDGAGGVIIAWHDARGGGAFDIYAQRLNSAGVPQWTANGVAICTAAGDQSNPVIVSDGAGGAIIAWPDSRGANIDLYAQRVNAAGVPQWAANGLNVCNAANNQTAPVMVSDGAGGAIIAWSDFRSGLSDIYADRVGPSGGSMFAVNGLAICAQPGDQNEPSIVADGSGGAIIAWSDGRSGTADIFAQRVSAGAVGLWPANGVLVAGTSDALFGSVMASDGAGGAIVGFQSTPGFYSDLWAQRIGAGGVPQWQAGGVPVAVLGFEQHHACIASDGAGGAILGWMDTRYGVYDIFAQRIAANGAARWQDNGLPISTANNTQLYPAIVTDGAGGAILAWHDLRLVTQNRVYAQRIERYGQLGNPEATITSVRDTPNDQGGKLKVSWSASYLDVDPTYGISDYRLWRSAPQGAPFALAADRTTTDSDEAAATGRWLVLPDAATDYAWELVGSQPAATLASYSQVTATTSDSMAASNPRTAYMVEAITGLFGPSSHWFSAPDSGYSVDNLPPGMPAPFTGVFSAGVNDLHWGANPEADLAGYRLYRGVTSNFVPSAATLLSAQSGSGFVDASGHPYFYKLSAVDVHGNESPFAFLAASATTGVDDEGLPAALRLAGPEPNPAVQSTRIDLELPREAHVTLGIYDAGGRTVRTLVRGSHAAGRRSLQWDLRDDEGRAVPSGIYFVRLETGGRTLTRRMVAMR